MRILLKTLFFNDLERQLFPRVFPLITSNRIGCRTSQWISTVRVEVEGFAHGGGNFFACYQSAHWESIGNSFRHCDNVWFGVLRLEAPEMGADSTKSGLHFVTDCQSASSLDSRECFLKIAIWVLHDAADSLKAKKITI